MSTVTNNLALFNFFLTFTVPSLVYTKKKIYSTELRETNAFLFFNRRVTFKQNFSVFKISQTIQSPGQN